MDSYNSRYDEHNNYNNSVYNTGEYYSLIPYYSNNDYSYEYQDFPSNSPPFFTDYDHVSSFSTLAYSATNYSEPKCLVYEPVPHYNVETRFSVSYSVSAMDDTDYEEYDPTPYGGGYDIVSTYGKPLSPSHKTCYPVSVPNQNSYSLSKESMENVDDSDPQPPIETKPLSVIDEGNDNSSEIEEIIEMKGEEDGNGYHQVPYVPSGYGLEAMDLCESLFGYWPCLSKIKKTAQSCEEFGHCHCCGRNGNPWNGTADYLFGSLDPYSSRDNGGNFGNVIYGYEKQYQGQNQLIKYVGDPWLGN